MKTFPASDAKNRFGQLIVIAQAQPVPVQRYGRDVAIVMSTEEFRRMADAARAKARPAVEHLHARSAKHWASVYEALVK